MSCNTGYKIITFYIQHYWELEELDKIIKSLYRKQFLDRNQLFVTPQNPETTSIPVLALRYVGL